MTVRTICSPKLIVVFTVSWNQANKSFRIWIKEVGGGSPVKCSNPVSQRGECFQSYDTMEGSLYPSSWDFSLGFYSNLTKSIEGSFITLTLQVKNYSKCCTARHRFYNLQNQVSSLFLEKGQGSHVKKLQRQTFHLTNIWQEFTAEGT